MVLNSFSFLILTYNHEKYIVDHLESIKFQIDNYGSGMVIDLVINDDSSKDETVYLVDEWINHNKSLFRDIKKIYNHINEGTAASTIALIQSVNTEMFKLTAGDDIYSFENIFEGAVFSNDFAFHSGFPFYFKQNILYLDPVSTYLHLTTQYVYAKQKLYNRFERFSYHNAPNLFYNSKYVKSEEVLTYLKKYDVIEDWPLQIAVSRFYPELKFKYSSKVFVYYRRTSGSIFLIANKRFFKDKTNIYKDLIENAKSKFVERLLICRLFCFKNQKIPFIRTLNFDLWFFFLKSICFLKNILIYKSKNKINLDIHQQHLNLIVEKSHFFLNKSVNFSNKNND